VTDANLHLGRLDPDYFLGGKMSLDTAATAQALQSIAAELSLDETALAEGVLQIVNAKMADAMRTITVKQGIDPRAYSLVAFGGAGPMHAVWLAEELDIAETVVPWSPGTFSAWGMLQTDMRHDVVRSFYKPLSETTSATVADIYGELEEEGMTLLAGEGVAEADRYASRTADMRYVGQEYTVTVTVGRVDLAEIEASFHEAHEIRYGHAAPGEQVEFVNLRLAAMGGVGGRPAPFRSPDGSEDASLGRRAVVFAGEPHETPVFKRELLPEGWSREGPTVIEELSSTTVVPPGYSTRIDELGNLLITR
jgi:N-methylhydantoinase A